MDIARDFDDCIKKDIQNCEKLYELAEKWHTNVCAKTKDVQIYAEDRSRASGILKVTAADAYRSIMNEYLDRSVSNSIVAYTQEIAHILEMTNRVEPANIRRFGQRYVEVEVDDGTRGLMNSAHKVIQVVKPYKKLLVYQVPIERYCKYIWGGIEMAAQTYREAILDIIKVDLEWISQFVRIAQSVAGGQLRNCRAENYKSLGVVLDQWLERGSHRSTNTTLAQKVRTITTELNSVEGVDSSGLVVINTRYIDVDTFIKHFTRYQNNISNIYVPQSEFNVLIIKQLGCITDITHKRINKMSKRSTELSEFVDKCNI